MLSGAEHRRDSFWATITSLVVAGWLGGLVASLVTNAVFIGDVGPLDTRSSPVGYFLVSAALAGSVTAIMLPRVLSAVAGRSVSRGRAFGVVFVGEATAVCVQLGLLVLARSHPTASALGLLWIAPLAAQVYVSYTLLSDSLERAEAPAEIDRTVERWLEEAASEVRPAVGYRETYARALAEAQREIDAAVASSAFADPPTLERLEARADRLAELDPPEEVARPAQAMLVRGLRRLERDLRERRSLEDSEGVETVRAAFAELQALGVVG